jgi:putative transcriptional regulator
MKLTPHRARLYLFLGAFLLAFPTLAALYKGTTGKLLIASTITAWTPFEKTVVFVYDHGLFSAVGFIVNIPLSDEHTVNADLLREAADLPHYYGGPVYTDTEKTIMSVGDDGTLNFRSAGLEGQEGFKDVMMLHGYAGWAPGQLNYELLRGGWGLLEYDPDLVINTPSDRMWYKARDLVIEKNPAVDSSVL